MFEADMVAVWQPCGGGYSVEFLVDGKGPFRAVVDTGSPFFTVSGEDVVVLRS